MIFNGKRIFLFLCVMGLSINSFAQDGNSTDVKRFSFGGLVSMLPGGGGSAGNLEFGFPLFHNETYDIRNHIYISGPGIHDDDGVENNIVSINENINVGKISANGLFRYYGFLEGGIGVYGTKTKEMLETPLAYNFGFGFGLDIFVRNDAGFLIEGGINEHILGSQWLFMPRMTIGARSYLLKNKKGN